MEIHNASATLSNEALLAFSRPPRRMTFSPGEELYRFASTVSPTFRGNDVFGSPWWIPLTTFRTITKTAYRTQTSILGVARSGLAIAEPWNPTMQWLIVIELKKAVYGWVGPAKAQPLDGRNRSVLFGGNYDQAYVPGLAPEEAMASDAATLVYFGSPEF